MCPDRLSGALASCSVFGILGRVGVAVAALVCYGPK